MSNANESQPQSANVAREVKLQRAVTAFIVTGLLFMLLPGTFLGVWNLISISTRQQLQSLSAAWIQAHGHAQIYGWIGTFVIGIGFYSLSKMGQLPMFAVRRAWISYALWTAGVTLRWAANITSIEWRIALPASALLELGGFLVFFATVSRHKPNPDAKQTTRRAREPWMLVVVASTVGFLFALLLNAASAFYVAFAADSAAVPGWLDQRLLPVPVWAFLVPTVWGFNARWLPIFLGLRAPNGRRLLTATGLAIAGAAAAIFGFALLASVLLLIAVVLAITGLYVWASAERPAKTVGVHPTFPVFVRIAYVWLAIAAVLTLWASAADRSGGIWGASRHAVTVGFLAAMVFAIGQRILPAFCGARVLFSKQLMFASLLLLNAGCSLRVLSEIPAYEGFAYAHLFWRVLPISAITELTAVALFAANLLVTFCRLPEHLRVSRIPGEKRVFA